jgi:HD-GYP domain-containing protein (c-di-GMP phosphodiesterase class II)
MQLAAELGLRAEQRSDVFYTSLLVHTGCTAGSAHFAAVLAHDEVAAQRDFCLCDSNNFTEVLAWMRRNVAPGASLPERVGRMVNFMLKGGELMAEVEGGCSDVGGRIAGRLFLSAETVRSLHNICESWSGKGPRKLRGAQIPLPARIVSIAAMGEVFSAAKGPDGAKAAIAKRSGRSMDPEVARAFASLAGRRAFWERLAAPDLWPTILELEPEGPRRELDPAALDDVALALADFADLKTPRTAAHSRAASELAVGMARRLGLSAEESALVRRAGLVHDVGKVGVPVLVLNKRGPLNPLEEMQLRLHPELSARILSGASAFAPVASIVAMHHERLDGSGYPRGLPGAQLPRTARILAVADSYLERVHDGSGVADGQQEEALAALRSERGRGLDGDCVEALLAEVGVPGGSERSPKATPQLSEREVEVLRLAAKELTIKEIGKLLFLSPHTVRHHLEHIYEKIGASSRAGAVLYAMEQGLLHDR